MHSQIPWCAHANRRVRGGWTHTHAVDKPSLGKHTRVLPSLAERESVSLIPGNKCRETGPLGVMQG